MKKHILRGLWTTCLLGGLLWQTPVQATLDDTLQVLPAAPALSLSLDLNPKFWLLLAQIPWQQSEPWKQLTQTSQKNGVDLDKELLPLLGSHVSLAVYPVKDKDPLLMAALHVKDPAKVTALLNKIFKGKGSTMTLALPEFPIHFSVHGSTLIVDTFPKAWSAPATNLLQDPAFKNIYQRFQQEQLWAYLSVDEFPKLAKMFSGKEDLDELQSFVGGIANLEESYGFALVLHPHGVSLKSVTQHKAVDKRTPAQQALLKKLQQTSGQKLEEMLALMPAQPLVLMAYPDLHQWGDILAQNAPDDSELKSFLKDLTGGIAQYTGLDWEKDLLPVLDGRIGLAVNYPQAQPDFNKNPIPHVLLYAGVKDPAQFRDLMLNKFVVNTSELAKDDLLGPLLAQDRIQAASVKANMHTLQTMVETYAVDWGGEYPPSLAALYTEAASKEGTDYAYWKELTNPVTQQQGIGKKKAMLDYNQYKWFKAHPDFDGMVFYEPIKSAGQITGYLTYGYLAGKEYQLAQESAMVEKMRPDAPKRSSEPPLKFVSQGSDGDTLLYRLNLPASQAGPLSKMEIAPSFMVNGNMAIISLQSQAIRDALAHQHQKSGLLKDPQFTEARKQMFGTQGVGLTYMDLQRLGQIISPLVVAEIGNSDMSKPVLSLLKAFKYLAFDMKYSDQGIDNLWALNVNWSDVDFKWLVSIPGEMLSAQNRAKVSSVKANMHTLQTMVETYAVDWGGEYPATLQQLHQEALKHDYWKDFTNPFNSEEGIDKSMGASANYKPGTGQAGLVFYEPVKEKDQPITTYRIYGTDGQGELILQSPPATGSKGAVSSVKANMHTLQTMIETYAVDTGGVYPSNMSELYQDATKNSYYYWRELDNPIAPLPKKATQPAKPTPLVLSNNGDGVPPGEKPERGNSYSDFKGYQKGAEYAGQALYVPNTLKPITKYWIYGCDQNGELIREQKNNALYYLTNS